MGTQAYGYGPAEHEYHVNVPQLYRDDPTVTLYLSAHGGGTVGEAYAGNGWDYLVTENGNTILEGSDLRSAPGRAAGHAEMAETLAHFLGAAGESLSMSGDRSEYASEYSETGREWLAANHERLSLFSPSLAGE